MGLLIIGIIALLCWCAFLYGRRRQRRILLASTALIVEICRRYSFSYDFEGGTLRLYRMKGSMLLWERRYKSLRGLARDFGYEVDHERSYRKIRRQETE